MKKSNKNPPGLSAAIKLCLVSFLTLMAFPVLAFNIYLNEFNTNYGTLATRIDSCGLCHVDFNGGGQRTSYGEDYRNNNYSAASIGILDSDGDGFTNDQEAAASTLTHPGYSCNEQFSVINAPANIADYLDPANPGCIGPGQSPIANANGPYSGVSGDFISFSSAGSSDPDGTIVSYLWDFGSFGSSVEANPQFSFFITFNAKITFSLTVVDNEGNQTSTTSTIVILLAPNSPPVANVGAGVTGSANSQVSFSAAGSLDPEGDRLTYAWDFGDQTTGVGGEPSHTYARCGTYNVTLTVFDNFGLEDSAATTATISGSGVNPPTANAGGVAGTYNGTLASNIQFDGSASTDSDCDIVNYSWDFGDGTTGVGATPLHAYALAGGYVATLTVTDTDGLMTSSSVNVTIVDTGPIDGAASYDTNCGACHGFGTATTKPGATVARIDAGIATVPSMASLSTLSVAEVQAIADFLATIIPPPPPPGPIDGAASYDTNCGACHGFGAATTKPGATVARIDAGIATVPSMASLSTLSVAEVQAIADFLATIIPPPPPPGPIDGAASYDSNCGSCHGFGTATTKPGATVARIDAGIATVASMASLSTLSVAEVQAIADFLATITPPPPPPGPIDGAASYDTNCGSCHGFGAATTKPGATVARIDAGIATVASMASLSTLSVAEVQAIADFLATIIPPPPPPGPIDGAASYDTNCGACHGFGAATTKPGATVARIDAGIATVPSMASLSTLSVAEVQAIADFLATIIPPPPPPGPIDGAASYDSNCGSCHGFGTATTKPGATVARIDAGIATVASMASLSTLSVAEVQAIADFLATITPPPPPPGPIDGAASYDTNCGSCHGFGAATTKPGATVARIDAGIATVASMASLSTLSVAEVQAIADFLATITPPPPPPGPIDGAASYDTNCGACHGFGAATTKPGATVARIDTGIATVPSMASLSTLSAAEVQAISDFLMTLTAPTTPEGLYATHCGSCHGADGSGGTSGVNVIGDSANNISSAISGITEMQSLGFLTTSEVQLISDFLNGVVTPPPPPPGTGSGEVSYDANCGSCHGFGANSGKAGATVARINNGIATAPSMASLSTLPAAEIQLISDFLMSLTPPTTPDGLYATHCGSCHGADGSGGSSGVNVIGDSANNISSAIESESEMQSLSFLSDSEIQSISDFLNGVVTPPPGPIDGAVSYDVNCGSCHGFGAATTKPGATVARIDAGIVNVSSMASLSVLSAAEIQAIADFLASVAPPPPPGTGNGEASYDANCGSCHGFGANSGKAGATVARINGGIANVPSMTSLSTLPASDIQLISDFLMSLTPPTTPAGLYATHCGSCHGADGSGGSSGESVIGDSASSISSAIASETEMQSLGFLTTSEVQLISDFLNGVTAPPPTGNLDGQALYDVNCAGCHGLSSNSEKAGATAARINSGIANESSMNFFSNTLTAAEVQAIADFLTTTSSTPDTPQAKYLSYCGSCHGADGQGGSSDKNVVGDDEGDIKDAIDDEDEMNFLDFLSDSDIEDIADYLQVLKDQERSYRSWERERSFRSWWEHD